MMVLLTDEIVAFRTFLMCLKRIGAPLIPLDIRKLLFELACMPITLNKYYSVPEMDKRFANAFDFYDFPDEDELKLLDDGFSFQKSLQFGVGAKEKLTVAQIQVIADHDCHHTERTDTRVAFRTSEPKLMAELLRLRRRLLATAQQMSSLAEERFNVLIEDCGDSVVFGFIRWEGCYYCTTRKDEQGHQITDDSKIDCHSTLAIHADTGKTRALQVGDRIPAQSFKLHGLMLYNDRLEMEMEMRDVIWEGLPYS